MTTKIPIVWGGNEAYCDADGDNAPVEYFDSWDAIPCFANEQEEAAWYDTHRPSGRLIRESIRDDRRIEAPPEVLEMLARIHKRPVSPRIYPPEDEGKIIVEPADIPSFRSDAEREVYWQEHTLRRTAAGPAGRREP